MFLLLFYIFITLILVYQAYEIDALDMQVVLWPKRVVTYIGFKEKINFNTIIGIALAIFYIYLFSGNAEEATHFISQTMMYKEDFLPRADQGLAILILFAFAGPYLIAVAPGFWVAIGYNISFMTLLAVFSF